jgi:hypothetical protein
MRLGPSDKHWHTYCPVYGDRIYVLKGRDECSWCGQKVIMLIRYYHGSPTFLVGCATLAKNFQ